MVPTELNLWKENGLAIKRGATYALELKLVDDCDTQTPTDLSIYAGARMNVHKLKDASDAPILILTSITSGPEGIQIDIDSGSIIINIDPINTQLLNAEDIYYYDLELFTEDNFRVDSPIYGTIQVIDEWTRED